MSTAVINWDAELRGAQMLLKSNLVPRDVKTAEAALFIIMVGRDMGLSPVQALRSIRPIQGKIECSADLQLGLYHRAGGKSQWLEITEKVARLRLTAPWSVEPHESVFTLEDARRADLLSNPTWRKYPKAMLRSRAITQGLKDIGFLIGAGVYAPGEIGGEITVDETTGEVLTGTGSDTPRIGDVSPTAGVIEAAEDPLAVGDKAARIALNLSVGRLREAVDLWNAHENDQKIEIWSLLGAEAKKALREAQDGQKAQQAAEAAPTKIAVDYDKLTRTMRARADLDLLDADATLISELPEEEQQQVTELYHQLREALEKK